METLYLKSLNLPASRIGLGTWAIGGAMWGGSIEKDSISTILKALELNINVIDTAPVYGFGVAEEIIGKALADFGERDKIILATKGGIDWKNGKIYRNGSAERLHQHLDASLQRLKTDYIDIYQIHWPDPTISIEEMAVAMKSFLEQGKIRAIGVSNFTTAQMEEFMKIAPIHTSQPPYNLFERGIEKEIFPFTEKFNIPTLTSGSLCRGLLSGKITAKKAFSGDDIRKLDPKFLTPHFEQYLAAVNALNKFAQHQYGQTVLTLAIRWILDHGRTIALWGARHPTQLKPVKSVMGWTIDADAMKIIDNILTIHVQESLGSEFMQPGTKTEYESL